MHIFFGQSSLEHSGNLRTDGPKPPMLAVPDQQPISISDGQTYFQPFVQHLIVGTGWKGGASTNFWIVDFKKQTAPASVVPAVKAAAAPAVANPGAMKDLRLALECQPMKNLTTSLKALRLSGDGELFAAPAGLKAFGLPLAQVAFNPEAKPGRCAQHRRVCPRRDLRTGAQGGRSQGGKVGRRRKAAPRYTKVGQLSAKPGDATALKMECSPDFES
ncbi:hypothetical protein LP420_24035 [Massilia sp. B-10]|nr:hypothetical protein LP420_24035 [Massilia sp. B-10]